MTPSPHRARTTVRASACATLALAVLLAGCGGTLPPPSPPVGATGIPADEEQRIWARSIEEQEKLDRSGLISNRPELDAYLEGVLARLNPPPLAGSTPFRVRVVIDPTLNAFAYPNGALYIHTGLLARIQDEAQLATVLAHEAVHATHRHALEHQRQMRGATGFAATLTVGTLGLGALLGGVGAPAAISGYSKENEREADTVGFDQLVAAGYDPAASIEVFQLFAAEARRAKIKEPYFFGSHPRLRERISSYEALIAALPTERRAGGERNAERYSAQIAPVLALNAEAALSAGDPEAAFDSIRRGLALLPDSTELRFIEAEALRRRQTGDDLGRAGELFQTLSAQPDAPPKTWRGLGLVRQKQNRLADAAEAYRRYLELAPHAPDHAFIASLLAQCTSPAP
jgi:predicted Zn-dependent protease